jgi:AcrR family transcriptional regulator
MQQAMSTLSETGRYQIEAGLRPCQHLRVLEDSRPYGGRTGRERQIQRRARLREACLDLVGTSGVAGVSLNGVCVTAGLTKRYFYESYPSREALLAEVLQDFFRDTERLGRELLADSARGFEQVLASAVDSLLRTFEADPRIARLYAEAASEPALASVRDGAIVTFAALLLRSFPTTSGASAEFAVFALVSGVTDALCNWLLQPPPRASRADVLDGAVLIGAATLRAVQT